MKKKLLVLLFILTLTLTACTEEVSPTQNVNQIILNNVIEEITFTNTELEHDLILPTNIDGYTLDWKSNSPSTITNTGEITRPEIGEGDSTVVLTVTITLNDETISKDFTFIVKEATSVTVDPDNTDYTYEGYYEGVDGLVGEALKAYLHDLIDDHTVLSYGALRDALQNTDEDPNNTDNIILFYSGVSVDSTWDSGATWNREHSWPKSLGGFADDIAGSDLHHIRATYTTVNSARGNKLYDEGGSLVSNTLDCYTDGDSFEPRDEVKGDVARMMFYMVVRYEGNDGANNADLELVNEKITSNNGILGNLETLLQWNLEDPVDQLEMDRNEAIYGYQNNRNPFIDHPELVSLIWGEQNVDQMILDSVLENIQFPTTELEEDIVLPTYLDGYTLNWETSSASTLTNTGQITRPNEGQGDSTVTLTVTVTSNIQSISKDYTFTVKELSTSVTNPNDGEITYLGYYEGVDGLTGETLKTFLHDLIDNHTVLSYGALRDALQDTDEDPNNPDNIIMFYTGDSIKSTWDSGATWNREHSWPKSLGGFASDDAGSDLHHIRATYTTVNSARGNKMYDEGGSLVSKTLDCYTDGDSFEPRDEVKGDVARMMFYMAVRYEGYDGANNADLELVDSKTTSTSGILGNLQVLLQWNLEDPVDQLEMDRNEAIYGYQHNRNPFIDHPELVTLIWEN